MIEHIQKIIIIKGLRQTIISFFLLILIFSCEKSNPQENDYNLLSVEMRNYKYVSSPFSGAGIITNLKFKNDTKETLNIVNGYGNFQFILKKDTLKLGRKIAPRTVTIEKGQTLAFEFSSYLYRDLENYDFLINLIKNGTLYFVNDSNNFIPVIKSKDFYIDEGGEKGDVKWEDINNDR